MSFEYNNDIEERDYIIFGKRHSKYFGSTVILKNWMLRNWSVF